MLANRILLILMIAWLPVQALVAQAPITDKIADSNLAQHVYRPLTAILGAFPPELFLLQTAMQQKKDTVIQSVHFLQGVLNGRPVVLAQTGIGKVNAAMVTTLILEHFQPRELVFTGIAGGINPQLLPGDLVIGTMVTYHDYGTITPDSLVRRATRNPFTLQENPVFFRCDSGLVQKAVLAGKNTVLQKIIAKNGNRIPVVIAGVIVTGDVFVSSRAATQNLRRNLKADATEMEGAAVAQICWQQRTPFIIIRSLSDDAGNNAAMDVRSFYETAAHNSASVVMALLSTIR